MAIRSVYVLIAATASASPATIWNASPQARVGTASIPGGPPAAAAPGKGPSMRNIFYIIGVVVVVLAIIQFVL
ncbi:hypothetical protein [Jannaschia ovalis]|uniref:Uncharacterized protein n=1 Tax=Jannaschia ovalis TaxID=3038773 RepID=A0ABY8LDS4_9RHOB|nr:hypothetical protein [Jannaschia sp. GRR-S6-38]WGH79467.1 hypothetical protein P8627_04150 [Jannaschia sp. GRR-S6-38]